jgi:hypothetical protein
LTTGRFCAQCGKEAGGGAFCQHCGAAQAVADATAPTTAQQQAINAFCPSCGAKAEPGLAFCTQCGANLATGVPLSAAQYVHTGGTASKTPIYVGAGAVVVALIIAVIVMSGGSNDAGSTPDSGGSQGSSQASSSTPSSATPTGSRTGYTPQASLLALPTLTPVPRPPAIDAPGGSIGPTDVQATKAVEASLREAGFNLTGVRAKVFAVRGTPDQMLVLSIQAKQATALSAALNSQADQRKLMTALTAPPILKGVRVTRLAINIDDTDPQQGPYTVVMTMSFATAEGIAKGTVTEAQAQQQIEIRTRKG